MHAKSVHRTIWLLPLALATVGCVMPDQLSVMQKDLADVRQQLRVVQADQADALRKLDELAAKSSTTGEVATRADLADINVRIGEIAGDVAVADERMNDLGRRVDRLSQQSQPARDPGRPIYTRPEPSLPPDPGYGGAARPPAGTTPDAESLYNNAYADFSKGNFALAISGFEEYAAEFPDSALAGNALYWIGECHFSQGSFREAVSAFDRLLERYPKSDKAAAANLKKGLAFLEQNQVAQAILQLRYVVDAYPGSDEARIARDKLTSLGATP